MAGGMDLGTKKGGKKSLDTAINLVPFIDLMAVTISFLIMTAVWNQINRLTVSQSGGPSENSAPPDTKTLPLNLLVTEKGFTISSGGSALEIPKSNGAYIYCHASGQDKIDEKCEDNTLVGALKKIKADVPDQRNITVQCEDGVKYNDLVKVIDACNLKDSTNQPVLFPEVAVSAVG
ncbi:MAG TPA: biopolymer transporter ExbD [Myxococcales bacterium]